jgi:hypothetical protein
MDGCMEGREVETEGFHHERDGARGNRRFPDFHSRILGILKSVQRFYKNSVYQK